jgi:hypothetical protein
MGKPKPGRAPQEQRPPSSRAAATAAVTTTLHRAYSCLVAASVWKRLGVIVPKQKMISVAQKGTKASPRVRACLSLPPMTPPVLSTQPPSTKRTVKAVRFADECDLPIATSFMYDDEHHQVQISAIPTGSSDRYYPSRGRNGRASSPRRRAHPRRPSSSLAVVEDDMVSTGVMMDLDAIIGHAHDIECCITSSISNPYAGSADVHAMMFDDQHRRVHLPGPCHSKQQRVCGDGCGRNNGQQHANKTPLKQQRRRSNKRRPASSYEIAEF